MKAQKNRSIHRVGTVACAALVLGLAACAPGGGGSGATTSTAPSDVSTDVAAAGDVTLKLSDFWKSAEGEWIDNRIAAFEDLYPNVTIKRTQEEWTQLVSTLNLQLQDASGPDIASANNGWQSLGTLAEANLVLNLDPYAELYGWNESVPNTIARQNQFTTDFSAIGEGSWFATPVARATLTGLYYNVGKLEALGLDVPTTLPELEAAAAAAAAAGEVPFSYSGLDGNTAMLFSLQAVFGTATDINDFIYGDPDVTAAQSKLTEAAATMVTWADNGWLSPDFEGLDSQTTLASFLDGDGVFRFDYTGTLGLTGDQLDEFGYIQLPQESGSGTVGVGAAPAAMVIASKTEHPDVAAAFLDFLMSEESAQAAIDLGMVPMLHNDLDTPSTGRSLNEEITAAASLNADDGYVPYFDWSSPTMLDTVSQNLQLMLAGRVAPEDLTAAVDADRDAFLAQLGS
ncbi:carbohydrate ABC transporter substrate-binding protein (CUT1 family) [Salana multivorans]|uniref:Carbohydrate ABC transporter substrate-binding protein (CUT1 family) n=1 Tax=Salana multivorans TaxID=120377 RepID=A0A3N2DBL5_9MICO|nr:extracellular solute-binding protein [Salana multivorans]ROR97156.1 carbohydrate ABC transporter substrate-binding protein (CUT1 family) [Salana multivorans]